MLVVGAVGRTYALSWDAYYKNYFVVDNLPEAVHLRMGLQQSWVGAVSQRVRVNGNHRFNDRLALTVSYDLIARVQDPVLFGDRVFSGIQNAIAYRAADLDLLLFPRDETDVRSFALLQNLDRLVFTATVPLFDLYVGRQAVAWGSAKTVNPTDVIAPFSYTDLDTEDRIGVDALRLRAPLGDLGELDLGYVAGEDFAFSESSVFLRGKSYLAKTDFTGLIVGFREHLMIGADITRAIGGAGSWFEVAYVFANVMNDLRSGSGADYLRLSIGADHSLGEGTYGYLEYHFNEAGTNCPEDYGDLAGTPAYTDGAVYLLGEHYLATGVSYQASPLVMVFANVLANLTDPSGLIVPFVEFNFREDVYLEFGAYIGAGDSPVYITASPAFVDTGNQFQFHSEFGAYPDMYYASFRVYF
jgi:hypothetical protein